MCGNGYQFIQILVNLLKNAIEHSSDKGEISVELKVEHFEKLEAVGPDSIKTKVKYLIQIRDKGCGMSEDLTLKIQLMFNKQELYMSEHPDQQWYSLPISCELIDGMNGRMKVESKMNEGTCFTIELESLCIVNK